MRRYIGFILASIAALLALVFSLPSVLASFFTVIGGKAFCWAEEEHMFNSYATFAGTKLEDLRCLRCNALISSKDKIKVADEILNLNLAAEVFNRQIATDKIIEESKENNDTN